MDFRGVLPKDLELDVHHSTFFGVAPLVHATLATIPRHARHIGLVWFKSLDLDYPLSSLQTCGKIYPRNFFSRHERNDFTPRSLHLMYVLFPVSCFFLVSRFIFLPYPFTQFTFSSIPFLFPAGHLSVAGLAT